jgi:raffinose/stachyose/melibiose transport system substrate-binding protein
MKRKVLAGILAAAMMTSLLTGCGNKQASDGGGQTGAETESAAKTESAGGAEPATGADSVKPSAAEDPKLTKNMKILSIWAEDNDNGVLIKAICEKYQKEVNPNFTWDYEVVSSDNLRQKVATLVASNDLPDIFVYESGKPIVDLIEAGKLVNVSKVLKDFNCEDALNPSAVSLLKSLSGTEDIYDLPLGMNVEGFWYNKA